MANLLDKTDRAVRALIFDAVKGFNASTGITIRNNDELRQVIINGEQVGICDVDSLMGSERPAGSGNYDIQVFVRVKYPSATQPNQGKMDNHTALGKLQDAVVNQLHLSNNGQDYHATAQLISSLGNALAVDPTNGTDNDAVQSAKDNADMSNFSCLSVVHTSITGGKNTGNQQDLNFYEVCNFTVNVAGYGGYWN